MRVQKSPEKREFVAVKTIALLAGLLVATLALAEDHAADSAEFQRIMSHVASLDRGEANQSKLKTYDPDCRQRPSPRQP